MSIESRYHKGETVFAHWKVEKHLGGGSNARTAVFVLTHASSDEIHSALKVVNLITEEGSLEECTPFQKSEYLSAREACTKTATQEVLLMSGLQGQPNIVGYLDHAIVDWQEDGCFGRDLLIRMELLTDLRKLMLQGKVFTEAEILRIGTDICTALSVCHQKNILHRDIKPENIFVNEDGVYKLGDFGISRILDSSANSRASTGIGTPQYAAPEQFSLEYDKRVDLYSLGLVLYELCNGNHLPFTDDRASMPEYVRRRLSGEAFPELTSTSPKLSAAIFRACQFQPDARFSSAEEFSQALRSQIQEAPVQPARKDGHEQDLRRIQKMLMLGALMVLMVVLGFAFGSRKTQDPPVQTEVLQTAPAETETSPVETGTSPTEALSDAVDSSEFTYFPLGDGTVTITGYNGTVPANLMLPDTIGGMPVAAISEDAFQDTDIVRVMIPEGVIDIGSSAFAGCGRLKNVILPKSLKTIDFAAFQSCYSLEDIQLPEGLRSIEGAVFNCSGITSLSIPASVQVLNDTFLSCDELTRIDVAEENPYFSSENGVLFNKEKTTLLRYPANHLDRAYSVPESVKTLAENSFQGSRLNVLDLPEGLQTIEEGSISSFKNLKYLTIPASVQYIAEAAITGCNMLESITVAQGNKSYTSRDGVLYTMDMNMLVAFPTARTGDFTIPDTVTKLGEEAFSDTNLSRVVIPNGVKKISRACFLFSSSLESVTLPDKLVEIELSAFCCCTNLSEVNVPASLRRIDDYAFNGCDSLTSIKIPNPNCVIGEDAIPETCQVIR